MPAFSSPSPFTDYTAEAICRRHRDQPRRLLLHHAGGGPGDGEAGQRPCRQHHDDPGRPAASKVPSVLASLTKGGMHAATKSLAIEYATRGIRVNAVSPGIIKTPMHAPETHEFLAGLHPVGRMGEIRDIVEAVLYLEVAPLRDGRDPARRWRPGRRPLTPEGERPCRWSPFRSRAKATSRRRPCDRRAEGRDLQGHQPGLVRRARQAARLDLGRSSRKSNWKTGPKPASPSGISQATGVEGRRTAIHRP